MSLHSNSNSVWRRHFSAGAAFSFGNAVHINGVNGFIRGSLNSILAGSSYMTMEYWFKSDTATWSGNKSVLGNYNNSANTGFGCSGLSGTKQLTADIMNGSLARGTYTLSDITVKTHVRIVFDGTLSGNANRLKMYINGSQITFDSFSGTIPATIGNSSGDKLIFGSFRGIANFFDGWIDNFCLWNDAVGSDTYNGGAGADPTPTNLIAHCKFDESNPSATTLDETGNNTFTLVNFNYDANDGFAPLT